MHAGGTLYCQIVTGYPVPMKATAQPEAYILLQISASAVSCL